MKSKVQSPKSKVQSPKSEEGQGIRGSGQESVASGKWHVSSDEWLAQTRRWVSPPLLDAGRAFPPVVQNAGGSGHKYQLMRLSHSLCYLIRDRAVGALRAAYGSEGADSILGSNVSCDESGRPAGDHLWGNHVISLIPLLGVGRKPVLDIPNHRSNFAV